MCPQNKKDLQMGGLNFGRSGRGIGPAKVFFYMMVHEMQVKNLRTLWFKNKLNGRNVLLLSINDQFSY